MSYSERVPTENGATFCNSSVLINNEGDVLLNYRKTHLWSEYEEKRFNSGDTFSPVVEIEGRPSPIGRVFNYPLRRCSDFGVDMLGYVSVSITPPPLSQLPQILSFLSLQEFSLYKGRNLYSCPQVGV